VRVTNPRSTIRNIEVTSEGTPTDEWYIKHERITDTAVKRGTYMRTLTHYQYLSVMLNINAAYYMANGNDAKAIVYYNKSIETEPQSTGAIVALTVLYLEKATDAAHDFIYAPEKNDLKQVEAYLKKSLYYRNRLYEMGDMLDYYKNQDSAKTQ
jgi:hypothetical protein